MDEKEDFIDISDYFTATNEKEGIWYEPKVKGRGIGIEFKILGKSSDASAIANEYYEKALAEADKESDTAKRSRLEAIALAKRVAAMVIDVRGKDGKNVRYKGNQLVFSKQVVEEIMIESEPIRSDLLHTLVDTSNFTKKKG